MRSGSPLVRGSTESAGARYKRTPAVRGSPAGWSSSRARSLALAPRGVKASRARRQGGAGAASRAGAPPGPKRRRRRCRRRRSSPRPRASGPGPGPRRSGGRTRAGSDHEQQAGLADLGREVVEEAPQPVLAGDLRLHEAGRQRVDLGAVAGCLDRARAPRRRGEIVAWVVRKPRRGAPRRAPAGSGSGAGRRGRGSPAGEAASSPPSARPLLAVPRARARRRRSPPRGRTR